MGRKTGRKKKQVGAKSGDTNVKETKVGESPKACHEDTAVFVSIAQELKDEGNKLFQKRDYEGALLKYEKAIKLLPGNHIDVSYLRSNMAACFMQIGLSEYPRAIHECNLALEVTPKYSKALLKRARCYEALHRLDFALRDVNIVLDMEPSNIMATEIAERVRTTIEKKGVDANDVPVNWVPEYFDPPCSPLSPKLLKEKLRKKKSKKFEEKRDEGETAEKKVEVTVEEKKADKKIDGKNLQDNEEEEKSDGKKAEDKVENKKVEEKNDGKKAENRVENKKAEAVKEKNNGKKAEDSVENKKAEAAKEKNDEKKAEERVENKKVEAAKEKNDEKMAEERIENKAETVKEKNNGKKAEDRVENKKAEAAKDKNDEKKAEERVENKKAETVKEKNNGKKAEARVQNKKAEAAKEKNDEKKAEERVENKEVESVKEKNDGKKAEDRLENKKTEAVKEKNDEKKAEERVENKKVEAVKEQNDGKKAEDKVENKKAEVAEEKNDQKNVGKAVENRKTERRTEKEEAEEKVKDKKARGKTDRKKATETVEMTREREKAKKTKAEESIEEKKAEDKLVVKEKISNVVEEEPKRNVKLVFGDDIRWVQLPFNCSILKLREVICDRFPSSNAVLVKYRDLEGDLVTITTNEELRWAEATAEQQGSFRLYVIEVSPEQDPFYAKFKREKEAHKPDSKHSNISENGKHSEMRTSCIDDWIIQFAQIFKNYVGFDSDAYLDLHELGIKLYSEAMEETVTSEEAQDLFDSAAEKFQEMAALALFNWGNVHMSRARKRVYFTEDASRESILTQVETAYDWAQGEYLKAGKRYEEALRIKPDFYEGVVALGQQQFEQAKLSWYYAIGTNADLGTWPSTEVLQLYNDAEDYMERGMQMWEEAEQQRLTELSKSNRVKTLIQKMGLVGLSKDISAEEVAEQASSMRSQINLLWGTMLYERSIMEFKLGLPVWQECLEVAIEKFELAGASPTDIAVMIKNHCSNDTALEGLGFNIDEIVQAWNEMYEAKRWSSDVPSFRLEPLLRRRVSKLYHVLEQT